MGAHETLTWTRALRVSEVRAAGRPSDAALLERAKERALDPTVFDRFKPFFWDAEASSSRWDSYDTRMAASTLRNYADEAEQGVAFLRNHLSSEDPVGHSLRGVYIGAQGDGIARVEASFFALADPETAPYIAKLQAGIVRDVSVGFYGGRWICSICGRDMQQWFGPDGCPHLLGVSYLPRDDEGKVKKDAPPEVARATIEDAHLAEVSGVYDGATPGAMIGKARALASDGQLSARGRLLVEHRYRIHLPDPARRWVGLDLPAAPGAAGHQPPAGGWTELPAGGDTDTDTDTDTIGPDATLRAVLIQGGIDPGQSPSTAVRALIAEVRRLRPLADDGRDYRAALTREAIAAGQRAFGTAFSLETYGPLLESAGLAGLKRIRDDWAALPPAAPEVSHVTPQAPGEAPQAPAPRWQTRRDSPERAYRC